MTAGKLNVSAGERNHTNASGIGIITAMLFLVGEMAGGGVVALPAAMANAGWYGVLIIVIGAFASGWTGIQLSKAWSILQHRWPKFRGHIRNPYPSMGKKAFGRFGPYISPIVSVTVWCTFGSTVVYLILASQNIHSLIRTYHGSNIDFCTLMCIIAGCLVPFCWLGTPSDFWWVAIVSTFTSVAACVLITAGSLVDLYNREDFSHPYSYNSTTNTVERINGLKFPTPSFEGFSLGYGTIAFAYGGHSVFPSIQHDMKRPVNFAKSVSYGYIIILAIYLPVGVAGYFSYGSGACGNITDCLSVEWIKTTTTILISTHVIVSFIIVINPSAQQFEKWFNIPPHWSWKRMLTRTFLVALSLFLAASVPSFSVILNLLGSTGTSLSTYVFPGIFLICLRLQRPPVELKKNLYSVEVETIENIAVSSNLPKFAEPYEQNEEFLWEESPIPLWDWVINIAIITVGLSGAVAGTYAAIQNLIATSGSSWTPCYIR